MFCMRVFLVLLEMSTVLHGFEWGVREVMRCWSIRGCCLVEVSFNFSNLLVENFVFIEQVFD